MGKPCIGKGVFSNMAVCLYLKELGMSLWGREGVGELARAGAS